MAGEVSIIDYGMGNLRSVANALEAVGGRPVVVDDPVALQHATRVVMPGVGAFGDGMRNLRDRGWVGPLVELVAAGRPVLGICLGMQLLAEVGTEHGEHRGLGLVPGTVARLDPSGASLRVPHVGWNDVTVVSDCPLYEGLAERPAFYFLHSYALPADLPPVTAACDHGGAFAASVRSGNLFGVQYHPEKSHRAGLQVLRNFVHLAPC